MGLTVTKANVRELLEAERLWFKGDREAPIRIYAVPSKLVTDHWELPFAGAIGPRGQRTGIVTGAITDDWFEADGTAKEGYFLVDHV